MRNKDIYIVVPMHNEAKRAAKCLEAIRAVWPRIIVVDDGSTDATYEIISRFAPAVTCIRLEANKGKGAALAAGVEAAFARQAQAVICMDGDNQHHPQHIAEFVRILKRGYPIVIGIRQLRTDIPRYRKLGNWLMSTLMHVLFGIYLPDMMCGYRAFTKESWRKIPYRSRGYGVEVEMLSIIGRKHLPFQTVVVDTIYHDRYKGFSVLDGLRILFSLPYYRYCRL
jgi:glycosyltransferase involved in cell wall biosynthesis